MGQAQSGDSARPASTEQLSHELVSTFLPLHRLRDPSICCYAILADNWNEASNIPPFKANDNSPLGSKIRKTMLQSPRTLLLPRCLPKPRRPPGFHRIPQRGYDRALPRNTRHNRRIIHCLSDGLISGSFPIRSRCAGRVGI